jgi:arylsulfatase
MPHIPLGCSAGFKGRTGLGAYADAVAELDWSVGEILGALREHGIEQDTLVMFSSDNGPWYQGSPGRLRGRKGETYEGGMRVPFIARMPGRIEAGRVERAAGSLLDILPTACHLAGAALPSRPLDGANLWPVLSGGQENVERPPLLYFSNRNLQAIREGRFKLQVARYNIPPWLPAPPEGRINLPLPKPELYDLERDPEESYECSEDYPEIAAGLRARIEDAVAGFPAEVQQAWRETMARRVEWTPAGSRPSPAQP